MKHLLIALLLCSCATSLAAREITLANRDSAGLIAAIEAANADRGITRIQLAAGGLYTLAAPVAGGAGLPRIHATLQIDGRGAEIRRYGRDPMLLLDVAPDADLTLRDLTLAEGNLGVIRNRGRLRLENVAVLDSSGEGLRGALVNHGLLEADGSLFGWNQVQDAGRDAATLINHGVMRLRRCRFEGNQLSRRHPSLAAAGAVLNHGRLWLDEVEFVGNEVDDGFGGLASSGVLNLDSGEVLGDGDDVIHEALLPTAR
jgi:hypothetical protein